MEEASLSTEVIKLHCNDMKLCIVIGIFLIVGIVLWKTIPSYLEYRAKKQQKALEEKRIQLEKQALEHKIAMENSLLKLLDQGKIPQGTDIEYGELKIKR